MLNMRKYFTQAVDTMRKYSLYNRMPQLMINIRHVSVSLEYYETTMQPGLAFVPVHSFWYKRIATRITKT